jgi:LPS export ABC transporter protein LptC
VIVGHRSGQTPEAGARGGRLGLPWPLGAWATGPWLLASVLLAASCGRAKPDAAAAVEAIADTADQVMFGLTQYVTENGVRKAVLESDTAFIYENAGKADLRKVKVTFFSPEGDTSSVVTGKLGHYDWRTGKMDAQDDVVVLLSNGGRLTTSVLRYDQAKNEVSTDQHYVYVGPDGRNMVGEAFVTDPSLSTFRTAHPRGKAGSFTLPGQ